MGLIGISGDDHSSNWHHHRASGALKNASNRKAQGAVGRSAEDGGEREYGKRGLTGALRGSRLPG